MTQFLASFQKAFFFSFFFGFFLVFFSKYFGGASILNAELCSISQYARTILKRKRPKIQFSFYQEEEMQESHFSNLVRTVLFCIAETKQKKRIYTGYFTLFGKMVFFIRISAEVSLICFGFQNSKKLFKIGLFQVFPKWSRTEKFCRTLHLFICWSNIIPNN